MQRQSTTKDGHTRLGRGGEGGEGLVQYLTSGYNHHSHIHESEVVPRVESMPPGRHQEGSPGRGEG